MMWLLFFGSIVCVGCGIATVLAVMYRRNKPKHRQGKAKKLLHSQKSSTEGVVFMNETKLQRALSIRQPYAEQILRGMKTVEYRSQPTKIRERVYIYASRTPGEIEDFEDMEMQPGDAPVGVLVGSVEVVDCTGYPGDYEWHLASPQRLSQPIKPENHPQPSWFFPFKEAK